MPKLTPVLFLATVSKGATWLNQLGTDIAVSGQTLLVKKVPAVLRQQDVAQIMLQLLQYGVTHQPQQQLSLSDSIALLYTRFAQPVDFTLAQAEHLLQHLLGVITVESLLQQCAVELDLTEPVAQLLSERDKVE